MRTGPILAVAALAGLVALPALANAASPDTHVMTVQLPDGLTAQIQYVGDVPPKVALAAPASDVAFVDPFAMMQRMSAEMAQAFGAAGPRPFVGMTPAAMPSGAGFCARSIQITYGGEGQAPHIVTHTAGNCDGPATPTAAPGQAPIPRNKSTEIQDTSHPVPGLVRDIDWRR